MTGEIHEDVYVVLVDAPCRLLRRERRDIAPSVDETHDAAALLILRAVLIAIDLEALGIVMREECLGKAQHNMMAQVGRDIADANLAPLLPTAMEKRCHGAEKLSISAVRTVHFLLRHAQKMQREEDVAPCHGAKLGSFRCSRRLFVGGGCFFCQAHGTRRLPEKVADLLDVERGNPLLALQERGERMMRRKQLSFSEENSRMEKSAVDRLRLLLQKRLDQGCRPLIVARLDVDARSGAERLRLGRLVLRQLAHSVHRCVEIAHGETRADPLAQPIFFLLACHAPAPFSSSFPACAGWSASPLRTRATFLLPPHDQNDRAPPDTRRREVPTAVHTLLPSRRICGARNTP